MSLNKSISLGNYNIPKTIVFKDASAAIGAFFKNESRLLLVTRIWMQLKVQSPELGEDCLRLFKI